MAQVSVHTKPIYHLATQIFKKLIVYFIWLLRLMFVWAGVTRVCFTETLQDSGFNRAENQSNI